MLSICNKPGMCNKILAVVAVVFAIILGFLGISIQASPKVINAVISIVRFLEIMIQVLAVAALIKYLCSCSSSCKCPGCKCSSN
jgi:hypothetical protein